jgi:PAS domain S-box-containing protein
MKPPLLPLSLALLATLLGLSALLGWALDIDILKRGHALSVAMNPATAVCLALLGLEAARMIALNAHAGLANAGQLVILVVVAAGLAKLSDLVFGTSFAVDQTLFGAALAAESHYPSRMAPNTAACLVLLGVAMQLMRGGTDSRVRNAQVLAILVLLTAFLALAGNLFSARELTGPLQYIPMAFNTSIAICFIAASILSSSAQRGLLKFARWQSLRTRMTVASMVIFMTGVWSLTLYSSMRMHSDLERQFGAQQFSTVALLAAEIDQQMGERFRALETIAGEITPALLADAPILQRVLENRPVFRQLFNGNVFVTRHDGISIAAVPFEIRRLGINYADREYMVTALKEGKRAVGQPVLGKVLQVPIISMAVPIRNPEGETIGALVGVTDLTSLNLLSRITDAQYGKTGGFLLTATRQRLIIASSDKKRVMTTLPAPGIIPALDHYHEGGEGYSVYVNPLGVEVLASGKHIREAGWVLAAILPTEEAFAPIHDLNQRHLLSALLLTLLAGAATWWLMRRQLAPLLATVHALATQTESEQPIQVLPVARQDEIGHLIGAFNRLLANLAQRTAALAESSARYERAVNGTNDGLWEWIPARTGEDYLSPRWKQLLGYEDHELPNSQETFFDCIHPEDKALVQEAMRVHLEERRPFHVELRLRCKSGEYRWFSSRGQTEWDEQGRPQRMTGAIADITERKRAEASLQEITTQKMAEQAAALEAQRASRLAALNLLEDARAARAQAETAASALTERNDQLSRINRVAVDRELNMIALKRQVNALARELGRAEPFNLAFADAPPASGEEAKNSSPPAAGAQG